MDLNQSPTENIEGHKNLFFLILLFFEKELLGAMLHTYTCNLNELYFVPIVLHTVQSCIGWWSVSILTCMKLVCPAFYKFYAETIIGNDSTGR